jgi:hypothetical protein
VCSSFFTRRVKKKSRFCLFFLSVVVERFIPPVFPNNIKKQCKLNTKNQIQSARLQKLWSDVLDRVES